MQIHVFRTGQQFVPYLEQQALAYPVGRYADRLTTYRENFAATQRRIEELQPHAHKPFEHEEKLNNLIHRQQEIFQALDLTKNQASNQLAAEAMPIIEETVQPENTISVENKPKIKMAVS